MAAVAAEVVLAVEDPVAVLEAPDPVGLAVIDPVVFMALPHPHTDLSTITDGVCLWADGTLVGITVVLAAWVV